jgi:hypothetical protein
MMCEKKKKLTIAQIRTLYHFETPTLAELAGVSTITVYHALQQKPIYTQDAEKILTALSHYIGLQLSFEKIDMVTWEDYLFLWIIRASAEEQQDQNAHLIDEYHFVYARDQKHATVLASHWLDQRPHLPHHYLTPCPEGLTIGSLPIPGHYKDDQ